MKRTRMQLLLCAGTGCVSNKSFFVREALATELEKHGLQDEVEVILTGCNGFCAQGPVMVVYPGEIFYQMLTPEAIPHLVEEHFLKGRFVPELMYRPDPDEPAIPWLSDINFFSKQRLIALRNRGIIDPEQIDEYIGRGGYGALAKALTEMTQDQIVQEIKLSGLRGRGGAGFPTGLKWELARKAKGDEKHIVCNADEGDPGAFMDRSIIESDPHAVLEGMLIGAWAIGASFGHIYVRNEYPLALMRMEKAIAQASDYGLFGDDIFGTGFSFEIDIHRGGGAFVCGEETSLIASIEGRSPEPTVRPPFPVESGIHGKPTNINNVETWATVPVIIDKGADWFSNIGTETSKGTKVFSVVGKVNNTGLVEVPMGITMREIVYDIGGGIPGNKRFKAVQTGGPSGGCIPEQLLDLPLDYEKLAEVGSIMGSGGLIVMDEDTCMVDISRFFLEFLRDESCGKCTACREGLEVMHNILVKICAGDGEERDLDMLEELAEVVKDTALCGLGNTAPNPVLSTLRYFRHEYEAHVRYKTCPAGACNNIISSRCQFFCPLDQDVPAYATLIARGEFEKALRLIYEKNPLPSVCGRVCPHMCEPKCRLAEWGEPLAIKSLKRFVVDHEFAAGRRPSFEPPAQLYDKKIAIVGSGPAGLTAAYFLARQGFGVTILEALPEPGGMLAVGIPDYRLPRAVLNRDIDVIKSLGVSIETEARVADVAGLRQQGYDAVLIATGAHRSRKLGIPGEELQGVLDPLVLLRNFNLGQNAHVGPKVGIVGGGNAAIDAARTSLRLGAESVTIIYRRTRREMPAYEEEIEAALKEGVRIEYLALPTEVLGGNGKITGVKCVQMRLGEPDASGRRRPIPIDGSDFTIELDTLIPAVAQEPDLSYLPTEHGLEISKWNTLVVDSETMCTPIEGVFAAGDVVSGPDTVTTAMAGGKLAAEAIGRYLRGEGLERDYGVVRPLMDVEPVGLSDEEVSELTRPDMPLLDVEKRSGNFDEVELGYSESVAVLEAKRCLRCDREGKS